MSSSRQGHEVVEAGCERFFLVGTDPGHQDVAAAVDDAFGDGAHVRGGLAFCEDHLCEAAARLALMVGSEDPCCAVGHGRLLSVCSS